MALVLGLPLLWAAFVDSSLGKRSDEPVALLHPALQDRVTTAYWTAHGSLPVSIDNPLMKIPIVPHGYGDQLFLSELLSD